MVKKAVATITCATSCRFQIALALANPIASTTTTTAIIASTAHVGSRVCVSYSHVFVCFVCFNACLMVVVRILFLFVGLLFVLYVYGYVCKLFKHSLSCLCLFHTF